MPRKLGQHFLKDRKALRKIAAALEITSPDTIVEVGPGHGELTKYLLAAGPKKIIAVELDKKLATGIREMGTKDAIQVIEGDILKILSVITPSLLPLTLNYKLCGNIPYYITGHLLRKISELEQKPKLIVLTIQKEVAERICAKPPHMNLLAASVQLWGTPKIEGFISKKSFHPQPKVDSAIIRIVPISIFLRPREIEDEQYYKFIKILFKQPRKTILNNLREGTNLSQKEVEKRLQGLNLPPVLRPANLAMSDINKLAVIFRGKGV